MEALELKARYLVASAMTTTYVEVSKRYIMPAVVHTDRLSLPDASNMSKEARMEKNKEVHRLAMEARSNVSRLANAVSKVAFSPLCIQYTLLPLHYRCPNLVDVDANVPLTQCRDQFAVNMSEKRGELEEMEGHED